MQASLNTGQPPMCSAGAGLRRNAMQNANPFQTWAPILWVPLQWSPKAYPTHGSALVSSVHLPDTLMLTPCTQVAPGRSYIFNSGLHSSPLGVLSTGGHSCILCQPLLVYLSASLVSHCSQGIVILISQRRGGVKDSAV